ncbi:MAG: putative manganese-dependent inorganic diphosphatase, partial [Firmicutes bacterium]|nr:putative manganese-dependent inorganic diphosphatase [Bacillota bacterium]
VIMVDHNEMTQAVDGIANAEILEIIDHHRIASIETMAPVFFRNQPVGCTSTIIYQMYLENDAEISPETAGLLCAAILSDTLMFRSPTCTAVDKMAAKALAAIAGIDPEEFAGEMFRAGSDFGDKTEEDLFYQDFKTFVIKDVHFGAGQVNSMDKEELKSLKERMVPYIQGASKERGLDMVCFMLTNILEETTELLYEGTKAKEILEKAFPEGEFGEGSVILPGVVSRKKQLIPSVMAGLEE